MTEETEDAPRFPDLDKMPKLGWKPTDDGPVEELPDGFAEVRLLPGQQAIAPKVRWGVHFNPDTPEACPQCFGGSSHMLITKECSFCDGTGKHPLWRSIEWQSERYRKVTEAMNHAAAHAQGIVRELSDIASHQEEQLVAHVAHNKQVDDVVQSMSDATNATEQQRVEEILQLRAYVRAARREAAEHAMNLRDKGSLPGDYLMSWDYDHEGVAKLGAKTLDERCDERDKADEEVA